MARPLRLEFAGALYHITSRGNRQGDIYESDVDRNAFINLLGGVCDTCNWVCHAYCLMSNHYHLLIETPEAMTGTRNQAIKLAYKCGGYSMIEIADYFGLHYTSVSRIVRRAQ